MCAFGQDGVVVGEPNARIVVITSGGALNPNKASGNFQVSMMDEAGAETVGQCLAIMHCGRKPGAHKLVLVGDVYQRDPYVASGARMKTNLFGSALSAATSAGVSQVKLDVCFRCPNTLIKHVSLSVTGEEITAHQDLPREAENEIHKLRSSPEKSGTSWINREEASWALVSAKAELARRTANGNLFTVGIHDLCVHSSSFIDQETLGR